MEKMARSLRDSLCSSLFQHTCILTQVILLGPCDNHVILILQIEKLRLHETEPITQLCNKHLEELGLDHHLSFGGLRGSGEGRGLPLGTQTRRQWEG